MNTRYAIKEKKLYMRNGHGKLVELAEFEPRVDSVTEYYDIEGEKIQCLFDVSFYKNNELLCQKSISSSKLEDIDYSELSYQLILNPTRKSAKRDIAGYIRFLAAQFPATKIQLYNKLGWHRLSDGKHTYCAGDRIITADGDCKQGYILPKLKNKYHFQTTELSEQEAAEAALFHAAISPPYSTAAVASGLLGILHQIVIDAGIRPPGAINFVGETQTRKTSMVLACCAMYNRENIANPNNIGISRVNSSNYKLEEEIDECRDTTYIVDDLFRSSDPKERRENEQRVRNIIRNCADNSSRQTARSQFKTNCQILLTSEYLLDSITDLGRCFIVRLNDSVDAQKLLQCQQQPLSLSTSYHYFIQYLCKNYEPVLHSLKNAFQKFRTQQHNSKYERICEQAFLLEFAFHLYCDYAAGIHAISADLSAKTKQVFTEEIECLVEQQNQIMNVVAKKEKKNLNFSKEVLNFVSDTKPYRHNPEKCFLKGKYLYITCDLFSAYLLNKYGSQNQITHKRITRYFADRQICKKDGNRNVVKYGKSGKRFLALNRQLLELDAGNPESEILTMFI